MELAILPARDEAPRIGAVLAAIHRALPALAITVVDDASTDGTAEVARRAGASVVRHPIHLGYGAALLTGYAYALERGADRCVQLDADGQHDPSSVEAVLAPVRRGEADVVLGSRYRGRTIDAPPVRRLGTALSRALARSLAGLRCSDPTSGFQALSARALRFLVDLPLPDDYPDVDVLIAMHRAGLRIGEVAVPVLRRSGGSSMHGGMRTLYYAYKMSLASFVAATRPTPRPRGQRA